ncbi:GLIPR1-like protein 1 [Lineus longissimus]|uniref:GLIPR1-like protein 1 n=1 Tax=Lineus longissimus TaxID=88925 RepID=UPI002B4E237B
MKIQVFLLLLVVVVGLAKRRKSKNPIPPFDAAKFKEEMINAHRELRNTEPAADMASMTYDDELATWAQKWANRCKWEHGHPSKEKKAIGTSLGQNMWKGGGTNSTSVGSKAAGAWAKEKQNYDFKSGKCEDGKACGHYTQMVWATTTKVGCGYKLCKNKETGYQYRFVVCDYSPAGNYKGKRPYTKA